MIFDELTLHNFGLYAERQTMTLSPPSSMKPIVLIGGLNGGGKTTLLDALQLCLYGPHARLSNRGPTGYADYLTRCIHRGSRVREAAIELAFRHTVEGREDRYRVHRSWRVNATGCKEHFEVLKNDHLEPALADNWIGQVEDLMPSNIAHLFLFDGEQIENYASLTNSSLLIGAAIQNLLGLDVVDQLAKDLQVYERRKRIEQKDDSDRVRIEGAQRELEQLRGRSEALSQERAALRSHKLDPKQKALAKLDEEFRKLGGDLYEQRAVIEAQRQRAEEDLAAGALALRGVAESALPLVLVRDLLESAAERDTQEENHRRSIGMTQAFAERDSAMLQHLHKLGLDKTTLTTIQHYLENDRAERAALGQYETILDLAPETRNDVHVLLRDGLDELARAASNRRKSQAEILVCVELFRAKFESIPGADTIAELVARRDALRAEIVALEAEHASIGEEIERSFREIERKEQGLTRLLQENARAEGERQDRARVLHHSVRVRATLDLFRRAVMARHVRRIEQLVLESYQQLLRKASLVTRLTIHPESFAVTLYGRDNNVVSAERLSAGERQLLAVALLSGLARASGRPLPTAIDTPLGRLDTDHRMHLIERYFPFASHQVLLLSTNEEITGDYLRRLEPWIGRTYSLLYDDAAGATRIVPGYFEARVAA